MPDWTCCGSTPAHMMDHLLAQSLAARNLRQAAEVGDELLAPCPSCYQREKNAEIEIHKSDAFRAEVNEVLDKPYTGQVMVYSLPEYLMKFVGEEKIASLVKTDLSQLKVVPYYGCLLGRPSELTGECDNEQPMMMDLLLQAAGADVKWWNYKTECCGASVGMPKMEIQRRLSGKIIAAGAGRRRGRHRGVLPALPRQPGPQAGARSTSFLGTDYKVPILYLPQVLGLAFGLSADDVMLKQERGRPRAAGEEGHRRGGGRQGRRRAQGGREGRQGGGARAAKAAAAEARPRRRGRRRAAPAGAEAADAEAKS